MRVGAACGVQDFRKSSAGRSHDSAAPPSMPDSTIPSRSSTISNREVTGTFRLAAVLLERGRVHHDVAGHPFVFEGADQAEGSHHFSVHAVERILGAVRAAFWQNVSPNFETPMWKPRRS